MIDKNNTLSILLAAITLAALLVPARYARAVTQSVTANIRFETALVLTKVSDINFGVVKAAQAGNYVINTAGVVSATLPAEVLGGTATAGNITIAGSTTQTINISVGSYTANNGVTPSAATCAYNGGAAGSCTISGAAAPAAGKTLLIGATVAVGSQAAGTTAAPTMTVTVLYP